MAVVKADAYGHGLVPSARAAQAGGAGWLGVALLDEALALRAAGIEGPVLAWLLGRAEPLAEALAADIDLSVSGHVHAGRDRCCRRQQWQPGSRPPQGRLRPRPFGCPASVTGRRSWPPLDEPRSTGSVRVVGVWSHLAYADAPGHPTIDRQLDAFREAVHAAEAARVCGRRSVTWPTPRQP